MKRTPLVRRLLATTALLSLVGCTTLRSNSTRSYYDMAGRSDDLPFSHAVRAGDTLYVAGTLGLDPDSGKPPVDAAEEVRLAMEGIAAKLALAGLTLDDVVSVQVYCPDLTLYESFNAVYRTYFNENYPARAFIGSGPLLRGARFEISAVAHAR